MKNHLIALPAPYLAFLASDGPKKFNGWYAPLAKAGRATMKVRFLVYKPTFAGEPMTLAALLDARMNAEEDPQFERHVKQVGNPDGAMDVFDTVDGVENRQNLEHKVPVACFDGEGALVLDTSTPQCAVLQYDEEGKFVRLSASFDQFVNALVKKKPPEPDEEEENASDASDVGDGDE